MAHLTVTHYTVSAQPQYLLAGMPRLKPAGREALGLAGSAKRDGRHRAVPNSCYPQCAGEGARVIVDV